MTPYVDLNGLPSLVSHTLRPLPLWPISAALSAMVRKVIGSHPGLLARLGPYQTRTFRLDITDLPFVLVLRPAEAKIKAQRRGVKTATDAAIRGSLPAFLAMLHGAEDGDALFFSGRLQIDGDTSAVLALRNALDDAELDLTEELAGQLGALAPFFRQVSGRIERISGMQLHRADLLGDLN